MYRCTRIALVAVVLALVAGVASSQTLSVSSATGKPGAVVNITLKTDGQVKNLAGALFTVKYSGRTPISAPPLTGPDPDAVEAGPFLSQPLVSVNNQPLSLTIGLVSTKNRSGAGDLVTIPFTIPAGAPLGTVYSLHLDNIQANDKDANSVALRGVDGVLTVSGVVADPLATIDVSKASGPAGGTAVVEITASAQIQKLASLLISLKFDPALKATSDDVQFGGMLSGINNVNDLIAGKLVLGIASTRPSNGPGSIARITFHIPAGATAGTVYPIEIADLQLADGNAKGIGGTGNEGSVTVVSGSPVVLLPGALLTAKSVKARRGETVNLEIVANDKIKGLSGVTLRLVHSDRTPAAAPLLKIDADNVVAGALLAKGQVAVNNASPLESRIGVVASKGADGPGTVLIAPFQVDKSTPRGTVYSIEIRDVTLDLNGQDANSDAVGGTITIVGRRKGDIAGEGDDQVNLKDVTTALLAAVGALKLTDDQIDAGDLNGDGKLTISDVQKILRVALGLEVLAG